MLFSEKVFLQVIAAMKKFLTWWHQNNYIIYKARYDCSYVIGSTLCCDAIPLAKTKAPQVLHLSIIRLVLVGLSVAIVLQKRQLTYRSHELITDNLLMYSISYPSYIYSAKRISRDSSASPDL